MPKVECMQCGKQQRHVLEAAHPSGLSANRVCSAACSLLLLELCLLDSLTFQPCTVFNLADNLHCVWQGFFGCKHFSKTNALLQQQGLPPVDWQIDNA